ncbi:ABC transporter permease [uncultured Traorella sp.]|uniref:FtsX-like permease family protein n=1 Tax=uncultured Traorella sp. TaxID=1929048 RepID=UPI0025EAE789|nr:ABC transporter permease [uncultured Traorella sp.]
MKLMERLLLSIIRRPIKSLLLLAIVFIAGNVISGSLILYKTSQSIKDEINAQIVPIAMLDTPLDMACAFSEKQKSEINQQDYTGDVNRSMIERQLKAYEEIKNLSEVRYGDYGFIAGFLETSEPYNMDVRHFYGDSAYYDFLYSTYYTSFSFATVTTTDSYSLHTQKIYITDGRDFTEEELENGAPVMLIPNSAKKIIEKNGMLSWNDLKVGDTIEFVSRVYSENPNNIIYNFTRDDSLVNEAMIQQANEKYLDSILDEKHIEIEIIGFYDVKSDIETQECDDIRNDPRALIPMNFYLNQHEDYYERIMRYVDANQIESNIYYNSTDYHNYFSYFELYSSEDIKTFVEKTKDILGKYELDYDIMMNNDMYLRLAGPLETINVSSKVIFIVAVAATLIILIVVSILFMRERKDEIGILLVLGEKKKRVMGQLMLEMILIGLIGISASMISVRGISHDISEMLMESHIQKELAEENMQMMPEEISQKEVLKQYETQLENGDLSSVMLASVIVLAASTGISTLFILRMNPKDILL